MALQALSIDGTPMGLQDGWALGTDGFWSCIGQYGPLRCIGLGQGRTLCMDRPWAYMGPGKDRALGMDAPAGMAPWALGIDGLCAGMGPRH